MGTGVGEHSKKCGTPYVFLQPLKLATSNLVHNLVEGLLPKNNILDQNWQGAGLGEHPEKLWTPYLFLQPLKVATSNLVHNLGLGLAYQKKQRLGPKLAGVWAKGASKQNLGPPMYFCNR